MQSVFFNKNIRGVVALSTSKSITNRVLIINAVCKHTINIINPATSDDSKILSEILNKFITDFNQLQEFNVDKAGTAMRFLTAYFACNNCNVLLTGDIRMKKRPIKPLVDSLKALGATINYLEEEGYPPLFIKGTPIKGGEITIDGTISSQFITALLLVAPTFINGLTLSYTEPLVSKDYIQMTLSLMHYFGVKSKWNGNTITVNKQNYQPKTIQIEADWSSASYLYLSCLLAKTAHLNIKGLYLNSIQGDSIVVELFDELGIKTSFTKEGIRIIKRTNYSISDYFEWDFTNCPDLVQTMAVAVASQKAQAIFTGVKTLRYKETDRISALQNELKKFNVVITSDENTIKINATNFTLPQDTLEIETYNDHRMALSFAPLLFLSNRIQIKNPAIVSKSYPEFWNDLKQIIYD